MRGNGGTIERMAGEKAVSETVIEAVAAMKGVDPIDLRPPLYDLVDPEALDALFEPRYDGTSRVEGEIAFTMAGCEVVVYGDGTVTVTPVDTVDPTDPARAATD